MIVRSLIAGLLLLVTGACSTYHKEFDTNPPFAPHYYRSFDLELAWQAKQTSTGTSLIGTVTNRRDVYLQDLELTARLLDEHGKVLAKESADDFPAYLITGKPEPFEIKLDTAKPPGRIRFSYTYFVAEEPPPRIGYEAYEDVPHFGRFSAPP